MNPQFENITANCSTLRRAISFVRNTSRARSIDAINITSATTNDLTTDAVKTTAPVFGVLFDDDAIGISIVSEGTYTTPLHITGKYWNTAYHYNTRILNDFTENGVVLMLD